MNIEIHYFAILKQAAGRSSETVELTGGTADDLYQALAARHAFPRLRSVRVAINDEFACWETALSDGDSVAFIPPVAGG